MDISSLLDLWSYPYTEPIISENRGEFLIRDGYTPMLKPSQDGTQIRTLLPEEDLSVDFTIEDNGLVFDEVWHGQLAYITQQGNMINKGLLEHYIGNHIQLGMRQSNMILDGGYISIDKQGNIDTTSGLILLDGQVQGFAGMYISLQPQITPIPAGRGFCLSVFITSNALEVRQDLIVPSIVMTDLVTSQIGDYSTLFSVIRDSYSVDFASIDYIELLRLQIISQTPSTPYIRVQFDQRMRQPTIDCYPI